MRFRYLALATTLAAVMPTVALAATPRYGAFGLELKDMDPKVKPGDSFFD